LKKGHLQVDTDIDISVISPIHYERDNIAFISLFYLNNTISGWTSIIICIIFWGGIQLFSMGIIVEYIARINSDVKDRPLYVISETNKPL